MKSDIFNIIMLVINIVGAIVNSHALLNGRTDSITFMALCGICGLINVIFTVIFTLEAFRVIVREELEKMKTKQES